MVSFCQRKQNFWVVEGTSLSSAALRQALTGVLNISM
jgi:hypothetical protein